MLEILRTVTMSPEQYEIVIEGMRNSYDSRDKSDSYKTTVVDENTLVEANFAFFVGDNDLALMNKLAAAGSAHAKFRRMMPVWVTVNAPLYWWKETDTYKVGTVCNSCSTMHTITNKPFDISDFSCEHLFDCDINGKTENDIWAYGAMRTVIDSLNKARDRYIETKDKRYWNNIIQLLPSSYNQRRTLMLNYEVLSAIYKQRKDHKLAEWRTFCGWTESLPYSEIITLKGVDADEHS